MSERSDHLCMRASCTARTRLPMGCALKFQMNKYKVAPGMLSPTRAESSQEFARRLDCYTVTENERILTAEFPLQRQHDNERAHQQGSFHTASPLSARKEAPAACASSDRRLSNPSRDGSARLMASAPA